MPQSTLSDRRFKRDIDAIDKALDRILRLHPVLYRYVFDDDARTPRPGLIAQEMVTALPEVVDVMNDDDKTYSVRYTDIIPYLIRAIQELNKKVEFSRCKCTKE